MSEIDRNCLSYWFPIVEAAGLPVPETRIVRTEIELESLLDGKIPEGAGAFIEELARAGEEVGGYPFFLRTGHGSGKHDWRNTCFVADELELDSHVVRLVEWSHTVDLFGLPHDVWAARRLLPTKPIFTSTACGQLPIVPEVRVFMHGDELEHVQPYWPPEALESCSPDRSDWREILERSNERLLVSPADEGWSTLAGVAAGALARASGNDHEFWSIDFLEDETGKWWLTDMADGDRSFRWEPA